MKYNILEYSQEEVLKLRKIIKDKNDKEKEIRIDIIDLHILHLLSDFMNRNKIIKYIVNDKTYFSVQYKIFLEDLPILDIKQQALTNRLDKLAMFGLIEKIVVKNQTGSYSAFRLGEKYEDIKYFRKDSDIQVQTYQTTSANVANYKPKDYSTNNNKEDIDLSISKKNDSFNFKQELLKLGVSEDVATDWMKIRKKTANSERAFNRIKHEIELTGASANDCITLCADKGWLGFEAEWFFKIKGKSMSAYDVNKEKDNANKILINGVEYK